jgi:hypothetical protein
MQPGEKFSDAEVRKIKAELMAGTHHLSIAIAYGVSENTIWRMKTGRTYNHVKVEGEEAMRPRFQHVMEAPGEKDSRYVVMPKGKILDGQELEEAEARSLRILAEKMKEPARPRPFEDPFAEVDPLKELLAPRSLDSLRIKKD